MTSVYKKMGALLVAGMLVVSCSGLAACSNEESQEEPAPVEETEELRTIGTPTDDAIEIIVENDSGKDIIGFAIKVSTKEEFDTSLVTAKDKIEDGEKVLVYIPSTSSDPDEEADGSAAAEDADNTSASDSAEAVEPDSANADVVLRILYNVLLTFDDDTTAELHDLNLDGLEEIKVCLTKDGIAYIEYENSKGTTESTLETEKALKEAADAATAAAEAQAQAEAEAAAQAEAEAAAAAAAASQYSYDYGSGSSSGSTGTQTEDSCVDPNDLVFN